ncbi:RidA family protein [Pseudomonas sp. S3_C01]
MTQHAFFYPAAPQLPFSSAVRAGGFLFLSGQIPFDSNLKPHTGPIEEQSHAVLKSIGRTLEDLGSSLDHIVKVTVWLSDLNDFAAFNEVYRGYFNSQRLPVRSLVQAQLAFGVGVEIEVQAVDVNA